MRKPFRHPGRCLCRRAFTLLELVIVLGIILLLLGLVLGIGSIVVAQSEQRQLSASMAIVDAALAEYKSQTGRPIIFEGHSSANRYWHCGYDSCTGSGNANVYYDVPYRPLDPVTGVQSWQNQDLGSYAPWSSGNTDYKRQWMAATLAVLEEHPTCSEMISKADPTLIHAVQFMEGTGSASTGLRSVDIKEFVDPWGMQVYILFPGRLWVKCDGDEGYIRDSDGSIRTPEETLYGICRNRRPLLVSAGPDGQIGKRSYDEDTPEYQYTLDNIYSYEPAQE